MMKRLLRMGVVWAMAAVAGCISPHGAVTSDVNPLGWTAHEPAQVVFENSDTLRTYDIQVILRHDCSTAEGMLPLRITTITPDSLILTEPVAVAVCSPGERRAAMLESKAVYRTGAVLGRTGRYIFTISPAPGAGSVRGVTAVGIDFITTDGKR